MSTASQVESPLPHQVESPLHTLLKNPSVGASDSALLDNIRKHVDAGLYVDCLDPCSRTPLYNAISSRKRLKVIEYLLYLGASVNGVSGGRRPVLAALLNGDLDTAEYLVRHGAALNFRDDKSGSGALHAAVRGIENERARYRAVEFLLNSGSVDASERDGSGASALHLAIRRLDRPLVELLVRRGADLAVRDDEGRSPLHQAVFHDFYDAARLLVERGAEVNDADRQGGKILTAAVANVNRRMIRLLLDGGARVHAEEDLLKAAEVGSLEAMQMLVSRGARIPEGSAVSCKVFYAAFAGSNLRLIRYVVERVLDLSVAKYPGDNGLSPLTYVIVRAGGSGSRHEQFHEEVLRLLVRKLQLALATNRPVHRRYHRDLYAERVSSYSMICQEELGRMRRTTIFGELYDTTYLDALTLRDELELEKCLGREEIYAVLETDEFEELFPVYAEDLEARLLPVLRRCRVEEFCEIFYHRVANAALPINVIYRICEFFDDVELKNCVRTLVLV